MGRVLRPVAAAAKKSEEAVLRALASEAFEPPPPEEEFSSRFFIAFGRTSTSNDQADRGAASETRQNWEVLPMIVAAGLPPPPPPPGGAWPAGGPAPLDYAIYYAPANGHAWKVMLLVSRFQSRSGYISTRNYRRGHERGVDGACADAAPTTR